MPYRMLNSAGHHALAMKHATTPRRIALAVLALAAAAGIAVAVQSHSARAAAVDPGLVDINTSLGYQATHAAGTGIVLTSSGEVLTNNHVIRGATRITATDLGNGRTYTAKVVGYSVANDVAVLQLQGASGLQTATVGDSSSVKIGDAVSAVGNAGGAGGAPTTTSGRVTGLNRTITARDDQGDAEQLTGLIETDAALQPGDYGGALVDSSGRVIGMLTAASAGFRFSFQPVAADGYAIAINKALSLVKQIEAKQASATVHIGATGFLGVTIQQPVSFGYPYFGDAAATNGALVTSVLDGSPAARLGLGSGDVITAIDGHAVSSARTLSTLLLARSPGNRVTVGWVDQSGASHRASVRLASGPPQ